MFRLNRPHLLPIGVDIGRDSVKMLQFEVREQKLIVYASARQTLEFSPVNSNGADLIGESAANVIREMLGSGSFSGRSAVVALPRHIVHVKNLRLPPMPPGELSSVIEFEARSVFPIDTAEARVEYLIAGEIRQGTDVRQEVVLLAARYADIDRFVEQLHRTGLVLDSVDVEPCALYRTIDRFVRRRDDEQEVHVLVDVGTKCTQVLIGKGRDISFFKAIETGGADFNLAVSRKLGIAPIEARALRRRLQEQPDDSHPQTVRQAVSDATRSVMENLTREISLCLRYHSVTFRGQRPLKVRVSGGEGGDQQLLSMLQSVLAIPVESARPLFNVECAKMHAFDRHKPSGEWAIAMGLGLKRSAGRFAPLDGTPRSQAQPVPAQPGAGQSATQEMGTAATPVLVGAAHA
jgi:type IV pilus assembly protein PilM